MKISESHRRRCGGFCEGFGEFATFHPDYEYLCPDCGKWSREGSDVSTTLPDGEAFLCHGCAQQVTEDLFSDGDEPDIDVSDADLGL